MTCKLNYRKRLFIFIFMIFNTLFMSLFFVEGVFADAYYVSNRYSYTQSNMNFYDIDKLGENYWGKEAIYRMSALTIFKGYDDSIFSPSDNVTRSQILALLYRAIGKEKNAEYEVGYINELRRVNKYKLSKVDEWANGYYSLAYKDSLITKEQFEHAVFEIDAKVGIDNFFTKNSWATREEVVEWIIRIFNMGTESIDNRILLSYDDYHNISSNRKQFIASALYHGIIKGDRRLINADKPINRVEIAQILNNSLEYIFSNQGLTERHGIVHSINMYNYLDVDIDIINTNNNIDRILIEKTNDNSFLGIPVLKNGNVLTSDVLQGGDAVKYITDSSNIIRYIEVVKKDQQNKVKSSIDIKDLEVSGIVRRIDTRISMIQLNGLNGEISESGARDFYYLKGKMLKVFKNGKHGNIDILGSGDTVVLQIDSDGYIYEIASVENEIISYGSFSAINSYNIEIIDEENNLKKYNYDNKTVFSKNGKIVDKSSISYGDKVKLAIKMGLGSNYVSQVIVESNMYNIESIYRAVIEEYNGVTLELTVKNIKYIENGQWMLKPSKGFYKIILDKDIDIAYEDEKIRINDINILYRGREAYIITKKDFGGAEKAVIIRLLSQLDHLNENLLTEKIDNISPAKNELKLFRDSSVFYISNSSIIIKNGKLVRINDISKGDQVTIASFETGTSKRQKVSVLVAKSVSESDSFRIYRGEIRRIDDHVEFNIRSYSRLSDSVWRRENTTRTFELNEDTQIFYKQGIIGVRDFNEYSEYRFLNMMVSVVVSDGKAVAISDSSEVEYIIEGKVNIPYGFEIKDQLNIGNVRTFDPYSERWTIQDRNAMISIDGGTVIIKNYKIIQAKDLMRGDSVKVMKNNRGLSGRAIFIIVEN